MSIPAEVIERARAVGLEYVLAARGITLRGRGLDRAGPCPRCGGMDRFSVHLGKGVFNCRGCGAKGGDAIALVQFLDRCGFREAVEILTGARTAPHVRVEYPPRPLAPSGDDGTNRARAMAIWQQAEPIGDVARAYLVRRGIALENLPIELPRGLRFHPACPWEQGTRPCLVALWTDVLTNAPHAIHRRPLTDAGEAAAHWCALAPTAGCVIRLWPQEDVTHGLVVGEGIETTLAAATRIEHRHTLLQPAWACGDAGHLAVLPALPDIEALTILVDHDANGTGQRAAHQCAQRWKTAGRWVFRLTPRIEGADFSDVVCS